jgi:hypothetical protein
MDEIMELLRDVGTFLVSIGVVVVLFKVGGLLSALSGRIKDGTF